MPAISTSQAGQPRPSAARQSGLGLVATVREPQIVLATLARLRWLAVFGQLLAAAAAIWILKRPLPLAPIAAIIILTAISNLILVAILRWHGPTAYAIPLTLLLDVCLLTALLYLTGGPRNPFSSLYLVHVAMAVIVLGTAWTWVIVSAASICYGLLFVIIHPSGVHPDVVTAVANWTALVLVAVLIAVFIGQVIRSLRLRELELANLRERASKNEHLAALTTLAAGAAHELNTPLGTIAVAAKELERNVGPAPAANLDLNSIIEDAQLIRREVDRCRAILSRMKLDVGEDASQHKLTLISDLDARLRENLLPEETGRMRTHCDPACRAVVMPARAIEQALLVLLRNAFDASPPQSPVDLDVRQHDGHFRFTVEDRGHGMPPELLRRAGEPFFTTKEPGSGMGLGLYLVGLVAERCGATFLIDSRQGEGTRCTLDLPREASKL